MCNTHTLIHGSKREIETEAREIIDLGHQGGIVIGSHSVSPEICLAALAHGKPVYVEKPMAPTVDQCIEIQRAAWKSNLPVAVGFNRRFAPAVALLAEAFRSSGPPTSVIYRISDDDRIRPPEQSWKQADRLRIEAVHIFDLLAYLLQAEPVRIFAGETRTNDALVTLISIMAPGPVITLQNDVSTLISPLISLAALLAFDTIGQRDQT